MESPERRKLVFLYPEYNFYRTLDLPPRHTTEQQFKNVLEKLIGTNSTLLIRTGEDLISMPPKTFIQAETMSPEDREKFLTFTAQAMKQAKRVTLKIPPFMFSKN